MACFFQMNESVQNRVLYFDFTHSIYFFTIEQFDKCFATLKVDSGRDFVALTKNARSSSRKRKPHQKNNIRVKNVMAKKICIMFSRSIGNSCNRGQERFACRHYFLGKSTKMATKVKNNEIGLKR